jgi:hypothetical protein
VRFCALVAHADNPRVQLLRWRVDPGAPRLATIGASFAVSEVEVRSSRTRSLVLGQSVLSFFYDTAILGVAIGVVSGAGK